MVARGIHHVGVAVRDLDAALDTYTRTLGAALEHRETLRSQGVEAAAVLMGTGRVELLASLGEDTPVGRFLARRGEGMHHVAYEEAQRLLVKHRVTLDRVAQALLEQETLTRDELHEMLGAIGPESRSSETVGTVRALPAAEQ